MIRTALVGFGKSAKVFHLPFLEILPQYTITAFVSSRVDEINARYPQAKVYSHIAELAEDKDIDLVIINSPTFLHYEQAKILLQAGKHLVVEKPFTVKHTEAKELIELAANKGLKLTVYHNRRWDNGFLTLRKLIDQNILGEIYHYEVNYDRWRPIVQSRWREQDTAGAGILYDLGSHMIDQMLILFGEPDDVIPDIQCQREGSLVTDYFHLIFKYGRMRAVLRASSLVQASPNHLLVHAANASLWHNNMDPQEQALIQGLSPSLPSWGIDSQSVTKLVRNVDGNRQEILVNTERGSYQSFYELMAKAILYNEPVPVDANEILPVIKILENLNSPITNTHFQK